MAAEPSSAKTVLFCSQIDGKVSFFVAAQDEDTRAAFAILLAHPNIEASGE
jgi:hypothetical protein